MCRPVAETMLQSMFLKINKIGVNKNQNPTAQKLTLLVNSTSPRYARANIHGSAGVMKRPFRAIIVGIEDYDRAESWGKLAGIGATAARVASALGTTALALPDGGERTKRRARLKMPLAR